MRPHAAKNPERTLAPAAMSSADAQARWHGIWARRGPWACLLWPIAQVHAALGALRRLLYATHVLHIEHLPVPVLVVGNVVVGGAGKTPTVLALLQHLATHGWHPGVVSRGHGRRGSGTLEVLPDTPAAQCGDEPALIRRASGFPVFVARQRADAARALLAAHPEVDILICDDGLQHLSLGRDLSIAVFDDRGVGNGWLLPAGLLREPWPARHAFAPDLVLRQTRADGAALAPLALPAGVPCFEARRRLAAHAIGPQGLHIVLDDLRREPLGAVAGIARPAVFFEMLRQRGLALGPTLALADHAEAASFDVMLQSPDTTWLCTEKDAVKLFDRPGVGTQIRIWAVPLELRPDPAFFEAVDRHLARLRPARLSSNHGHQTA
jgi:tetraacyldisaccharide 4'-kinase